jgi:5-methylcytosine-specific restriction endonuclease McrA
MLAKVCKYPSCCLLALANRKCCSKHQDYETALDNKKYEKAIATPYEHYSSVNQALYNTQRWRLLRAEVIKEHPYCVICGTEENLTVDHIAKPNGDEELFFNKDNLQVLCKYHHDVKTQQEGLETRKQRANEKV